MGAVTADIARYYDGWTGRLVEDQRVRNQRVVTALDFAKEAVAGCASVLDVGCGIGWTSIELEQAGHRVTGLDISPGLISTARRMHGDRCEFLLGDFANMDTGTFDAVVMIDVYEHFPPADRAAVHWAIIGCGARKVVLTVPTVATQQYARDHGIPLQPVDEDVTDDDIRALADDIGGAVTVNRTVTVWRPDDYRHVLIERRP